MPSRKSTLTLAALAVGALAVSAALADYASQRLAAAEAGQAAARTRLAQAEAQGTRAETRGRLAEAANQLDAVSKANHLDPTLWVEQKVNLAQAALPRFQADNLLRQTMPGPYQMFDVEAFDIAATGANESLFDMPSDTAGDLKFTLQGTLLARLGDRQ